MASAQGPDPAVAKGDAFAQAHAQLLADHRIQFALPAYRPSPPPPWLEALGRAIRHAWPVLRIGVWIALGLIAIALLWMIGRRLIEAGWLRRAPQAEDAIDTPAWQPAAARARTLLAEADALAAAGHYAEAARLVLRRSVEDIERHRPGLVRPATTARDLADAPAVPPAARPAFGAIARVVELALFADRGATADAWTHARTAYADFALAGHWR